MPCRLGLNETFLFLGLMCTHCTNCTVGYTKLLLTLKQFSSRPQYCSRKYVCDYTVLYSVHIASSPSLNFRGILDAFLKQCICQQCYAWNIVISILCAIPYFSLMQLNFCNDILNQKRKRTKSHILLRSYSASFTCKRRFCCDP